MYTFVFSVIFKSRWGVGGEESKTQFAVVLFVGMIVHGLFAEVVNCAPGESATNGCRIALPADNSSNNLTDVATAATLLRLVQDCPQSEGRLNKK